MQHVKAPRLQLFSSLMQVQVSRQGQGFMERRFVPLQMRNPIKAMVHTPYWTITPNALVVLKMGACLPPLSCNRKPQNYP
jgi:hypothetical protein